MWTVPAELAKNGIANEVPLAPLAIEILEGIEARARDRSTIWVFPAANGSGNPVSGFSRAKANLDKALAADGHPLAAWRAHDLRRSAASGMARLGIAPHVIERVLNHASGQISGVAATYNRIGYLPEKRHALEAWAAHVERLLDPTAGDNVVPLPTLATSS
jgi:integrase